MKQREKHLKLLDMNRTVLDEEFIQDVLRVAKGSLFADFLCERMTLFHTRQKGCTGVSKFETLNHHRYTNPYRMLDRVSQYLIQNVMYIPGDEVQQFFRIYLFRVFNEPKTWELINKELHMKHLDDLSTEANDVIRFVTRLKDAGEKLFRPAYKRNTSKPFIRYLDVLKTLEGPESRLTNELCTCNSVFDLYYAFLDLDGFGPFLSYQLAIDMWYTGRFGTKMDFVVPGPGAKRGINYMYGSKSMQEMISILRVLTACQNQWLHPDWRPFIHGSKIYPLQLNDVQNVFCEFSKFFSAHYLSATVKRKLTSNPERLEIGVPPSIFKGGH